MQLKEVRKPRSHFPSPRIEQFTMRESLPPSKERELRLEPWVRSEDRYEDIDGEH